ncbi:class V aminotransferase [Virgibacillus pantothenticus]|uniref:Class V aminotransferase n=1 Tax=Virgibacillus pantothenticus TaxID=1473 RepID=A0A0L0QTK2_VIRPA|nr:MULTISPECIES: alanine--glyoxylate aminotransferase family protein [Virgibacillus]API91197.1 class V aminotransferase [Virgibacillus sp. 6R]KNE21852.1 class V aminotransferase [Virgibacillus pantothenticus]MBS7429191.1 alanine--glyoxylate aminotransferase family protein [Virgibacillus sp. 19R1-5]MBU8567983.1 alanine--glyoxylate aminotransferase family protein [Virgibacillus pantothenticus]MBU8601760.1 alanine--glyoxylate aminotransferase family protein [Virgibacillus pantothenticus]
MQADKQLLRIPGPTPIPPSVQRAMSQPMIGHRGQEMKELINTVKEKLKPIFGTQEDVLIYTASGTAALETAVINAVQPGDEVLIIVTGAFGDRFTKICDEYHMKVHKYEVTWGEGAEPEQLAVLLQKLPNVKAVFATFCETSTAVLNPIKELAKVVHRESDALFIVDGVSCIGGTETKMDEWGLDIVVTGSQKAMMLPAGLAFIAASNRAWKVIEANPHARFYLDMRKYRDKLQKDSTPFTPAVSLLQGLKQALALMDAEGLHSIYERHETMKVMTRAAFKALSIPLLTADVHASPTVTAVKPDDFAAEELRKVVKTNFGLTLAGGQQHLKGQIFRIGHMGYCSPADILQVIGIIEIGLQQIGKTIDLGLGVKAAQTAYLEMKL